MKSLLTLALAALLLPAAGPSPSERGRALTASFYKGEDAVVWDAFSDRMKSALGSVGTLKALRAKVEEQAGVESAILGEKVEKTNGYDVYLRTARFTKSETPVSVCWTFGSTGQVDGFYIRPARRQVRPLQLIDGVAAAFRVSASSGSSSETPTAPVARA